MKVLIFDTETSGLDAGYNVILQLSYQIVETSDWRILKEVNHYFAWPENESRVSAEAIQVNGLTKEYLSQLQLSDKFAALSEFVTDKDSADLIVAHNIEFDKKFIIADCNETGVKYAASGWSFCYDTMKQMTSYCAIPKMYGSGYKWPKLSELAECLNINYSDITLHNSTADVELTKRCFKKIVDKGIYHLPKVEDSEFTIKIEVDSVDDIRYTVYRNGEPLSDMMVRSIISAKNLKAGKQEVLALWTQRTDEEIATLVQSYRNAPSIKSQEDYIREFENIQKQIYTPATFQEQEPTIDTTRQILMEEAKRNIRSLLFWTNKSKRQQYVESYLDERFHHLLEEYNQRKTTFEQEEQKKKDIFDAQAEAKYTAQKTMAKGLIDGEIECVNSAIEDLDKDLALPLPMSVKHSYNTETQMLDAHIELPAIDKMPHVIGVRLASGNYKVAEMPAKELREKYAEYVTGAAFYLAAIYMNASPKISDICIDANAMIEMKDGETASGCIYKITFNREDLAKVDFRTLNPISAFAEFPSSIKLSKTFVFKSIEK